MTTAKGRFAQSYADLLRSMFGSVSKRDAISNTELDLAEKKLRVALPAPLRDVYRIAGRHPALTRGHHLLVEPAQLKKKDGALIFLREHQDVCSYGVPIARLNDADPPVVQRSKQGRMYDDSPRLTSFLVKNLAWQANFVLGEGGQGKTDKKTLARIENQLEPIEFGKPVRYPVQAFYEKGIVVCACSGARHVDIYVASKSAAAARRFAKKFGLELDEL